MMTRFIYPVAKITIRLERAEEFILGSFQLDGKPPIKSGVFLYLDVTQLTLCNIKNSEIPDITGIQSSLKFHNTYFMQHRVKCRTFEENKGPGTCP